MSEVMMSKELLDENWEGALTLETMSAGAILHLGDLIRQRTVAILSAESLSLAEFELLFALRAHRKTTPEMLPGDICQNMFMTTGGISKLLKRAEDRGLVSRPKSVEDARKRPVSLTPMGEEVVESAFSAISEDHRKTMRGAFGSDVDILKFKDALSNLKPWLSADHPVD